MKYIQTLSSRMHAKSLSHIQLFCDFVDYSLRGSSSMAFQARILEWVAISSFRGSSQLGIKPVSPELAGKFFTTEPPGKLYLYLALQG